ncbi:LVIVD repeat-containing protein [Rhizohabitans arisaemae]|uniref:LVIVD repeat-containing protein n=1 Tax=Rhizohabitans arisaemae TaxID=2720610 RepID=UPI0024B084EE|nr:hypothetical protein [Rhizohabitans arisaemae]
MPLKAPFTDPNSWNSDLAFQGNHAFVGNFGGVTIYDIADPKAPKIVSQLACPAAQNDVSVSGDLMFLSVESPRESSSCESKESGPSGGKSFAGIRIFNIKDKASPRFVGAVSTPCGSHTHTLVPGTPGKNVYLYISPIALLPECRVGDGRFSVVEVPLDDPAKAKVIGGPAIPDSESGDGGPEDQSGCHDITVYPEKKLAAGACLGDGFLMDISDPARPRVLQRVTDDENFSIWHSATFNNKGTRVLFTDELGGGLGAHCDAETGPKRGADAVYDIVGEGDARKLVRRGYFKIPRNQAAGENCVAHNGSLIPVPGKDIMVQGWYQGGISVVDFTDPDKPTEIAYFDRPPVKFGGSWSAYYYNGYIYSSDITLGLDVLDLTDPVAAPAKQVRLTELNAQTQYSYPE